MLSKSILGYRRHSTAFILPYNNKPFHTIDIYMTGEQRTKNKEQRTKNKEQRTKNEQQRTSFNYLSGELHEMLTYNRNYNVLLVVKGNQFVIDNNYVWKHFSFYFYQDEVCVLNLIEFISDNIKLIWLLKWLTLIYAFDPLILLVVVANPLHFPFELIRVCNP